MKVKSYIDAVTNYLKKNSPESFHKSHGIKIRSDGSHIILDYDMLNVDWDEPYGYVCRGLVLSLKDHSVLSFGLGKFFNHNEPRAESINWDSASIYEKLDGTMVNRWWSPYQKKFVYSTRRQLPEDIAANNTLDYNCKWFDIINKAVNDLPLEKQKKDETWVLEVMTPMNKVVIPHEKYNAKILAVRNNKTFEERDLSYLGSEFTPKKYSFASLKDCVEFANKASGLDLEGFVVKDRDNNRVKIKGQDYLALHHLKNSACASLKSLIRVVRNGEVSEVTSAFPEYETKLNQINAIVDDWVFRHEITYKRLKDIESQKEFALRLKEKNLESPALLFSTRAGKYPSVKHAAQNIEESTFINTILGLAKDKVGLL